MSERTEYDDDRGFLLPVYTKRLPIKDAEAIFPNGRTQSYPEWCEARLREMYELTSTATEFRSKLPDGPETMTGLRIKKRNQAATLTVDHVPDWVKPTDLIEKRGKRTVIVSQSETIPRWRHWLNRITHRWRRIHG